MPPATSSQPPLLITQPLINSIPPSLLPRFDPIFAEYYTKYNAGRLGTHQIPIADFRANPAAYLISYGRELVDAGDLQIYDRRIPVTGGGGGGGEITVRIFEPGSRTGKPAPCYVNFHGGGWVFGGLGNDSDFCKRLCHELGCVVVDVDYRLAPEFPFPVPVEDCWEAFLWVREKHEELGIDLQRIAIGGTSAGGHLSAVVAHMARDQRISIAFQLLAVPVCDMHVFTPEGKLREDQPYKSYSELWTTIPLSGERMIYFAKKFLGDPRPQSLNNDWRVSPILAPNFKGLAPALVITAEMDLLKDEGKAYAEKMRAAGVPVKTVELRGAPHSVMNLDAIVEGGKQFNRECVSALREVFGA